MEINGKTYTCGLIGNPVEHTMSPVIHNTLAQKMNLNMAKSITVINSQLFVDF